MRSRLAKPGAGRRRDVNETSVRMAASRATFAWHHHPRTSCSCAGAGPSGSRWASVDQPRRKLSARETSSSSRPASSHRARGTIRPAATRLIGRARAVHDSGSMAATRDGRGARRAHRRAQDVQALHRRRVPAHRVRPRVRGLRAPEASCWPTPAAGNAQGHPRGGACRAQGAAGLGREDGLQPLPDPLPHRRADGGPSRPVRGRGDAPPRAWAAAACRAASSMPPIDRWVWYAGWADKYPQMIGTVNPVSGSYFNFSVPEPTGVVGVIAPEESSPARPGEPAGAGHRQRQRRGGARLGDAAAAGRDADRGARHVRRAGRGRQPRHRPAPRAGRPPRRATWTSTRWTRSARRRARPPTLEEIAVENVKRFVRPPSGRPRSLRLAAPTAPSRRTSSASSSRSRRSGTRSAPEAVLLEAPPASTSSVSLSANISLGAYPVREPPKAVRS